jgi:CheY-like chemotaxis protein
VLDRIFDPFFTTKAHGVGTGMGLSVVHGIINSYDGTIAACSEPGQGTRFKIYLPVIERQLASETMPSASILTGNECILFVDDEPALANISKQTLESLGYDVTTRTSSIEALELFKARPDRFDLVITDMTMPNMTGENLAAELMRIKPATPVILCTGFSTKIDNKKAMAMGIRAFISKPVLIKEIAETIRNVLDGNSKS